MDFSHPNERLIKKDYLSDREKNYVDWMKIFKNRRESGKKSSILLCISYVKCYLKSVEINNALRN